MSELEAAALGFVQGLTEFLPISSSGHLVALQALLGLSLPGVVVEVSLHLATLVSVLIVYRRRVSELVRGAVCGRPDAFRYAGKLALATLPAVVAALALGDLLEAQFEAPAVAGVGLLVTGAMLWTTRRSAARARAAEPSWIAAALIGCAQAVAILPGISRSGATVSAALALGVAPAAAAEFSFLMSVVAVSGAAVRKLPEIAGAGAGVEAGALAIGAAVALVSGVAAIWLFVRLLRRQIFHLFAYYAWSAGAFLLLWLHASGR